MSTSKTQLLIKNLNSYQSMDLDDIVKDSQPQKERTLGTFTGVFAPVTLAMFSSILFLRIGYIVGNAGVLFTLLQFTIAYVIILSTAASLSAMSSNGAVEGGGIYFMLSRTLGPEFGGAIGMLFYFANVVNSALYCSGCVEGLLSSLGPNGNLFQILPSGSWMNFWYCSLINCVNFFFCLIGSKFFGKTNVIVLCVVTFCIFVTVVSFFPSRTLSEQYVYNATNPIHCAGTNCTRSDTGVFTGLLTTPNFETTFSANWMPMYDFDCSGSDFPVTFFTVFGVLFSGISGILSGTNLSGELKNPAKSIPRGTFLACFVTFATFVILVILTSLTCNPILLQHNCLYMSFFSMWPPITAIGIFLVTFSSALGSLIGASRLFEAFANDVMFGPILSLAFVKGGTAATVMFTWFMVELFLLMGSLNTIAQLCSVLFLLPYGTVNLTCLCLHLASAPNFRPSYKYFSTHTCLVGLFGSVVMMFAISPLYSAVGIFMCLSLILAIKMFSPIQRSAKWGSVGQALIFHQVRKYLLMLDERKSHVKFWRPQMLLLVSNPRTCCSLIDFVNTLKKGGLYILGHVEIDRLQDKPTDPCQDLIPRWLGLVDHLRIKAFVELTLANTLREGVQQLVRISGLGAMKPNTIILGYRDDTFPGDDFANPFSPYRTQEFNDVFPPTLCGTNRNRVEATEYVGIIKDILKQKKNVCLCRHFPNLNKSRVFNPERESIFGTIAKKKMFLDVWLVNFFLLNPEETDFSDPTSLFLLQLSCIVKARWKILKIRVFISSSDQDSSRLQRLSEMLELLRMEVEYSSVFIKDYDYSSTLKDRLKVFREVVRSKSELTAVTFMYLPELPEKDQDKDICEFYLQDLNTLTDHLPPTILVKGVSVVTSTTFE